MEVRQREFSRVGTLASSYATYRKMVTKRFPEKMDESRLDVAIALYMRCAGYTMQEIANELYRHTPARPKGQNRDERIDYGRRGAGMPLELRAILISPIYRITDSIFNIETKQIKIEQEKKE